MNDVQEKTFWSKVDIQEDRSKCWVWLGARKPKGYGNVRIDGKYKLAHRTAFELVCGPIPKGMQVCHICDNPPCCNPGHLMLGNAKSNYYDMLIKNRQQFQKNRAIGERNVNSKLSDDKVRDIRRAYSMKEKDQYQLAELYGVSQTAIGSIVNMKTWRHVDD